MSEHDEQFGPHRKMTALRGVTQTATIVTELSAVVTKADGTQVDIGVISSPFKGRFMNWAWKKFYREPQIRALLDRRQETGFEGLIDRTIGRVVAR